MAVSGTSRSISKQRVGQRGSSRSVSALYGTLSVVLLVAALVMALIVRPPPPPSIAELGPSPQEQIEEARDDQAAGTGQAEVATAPEEQQVEKSTQQDGPSVTSTTSPPTTSSETKVPATQRCFGDPPRQTEDPHSPPCVFKIFEGDNGGETAPGVNAAEIRIVIHDPSGVMQEYAEPLLDHFNRRYEFYGRRLFLAEYETSTPRSPSEFNAAAENAMSHDPFAVVARHQFANSSTYFSRLANEGIHSVSMWPPGFYSDKVSDGLFWTNIPHLNFREKAVGEFVCQALAGKVARHAGDEFKKTSRKFALAVLRDENEAQQIDLDVLRAKLQQCEAPFTVFEYTGATRFQVVQKIANERYTTVIPAGIFYDFGLMRDASNLQYFPEWLAWGNGVGHREDFWSFEDGRAEQVNHAFGISPMARVRPAAEIPACWAVEEGGSSCGNYTSAKLAEELYEGLRIVASGVQGAGPDLTPGTFRQSLWDMVWPNPNPGAPPYWQQRVSFGPSDPVFYDDYAIWSWDESLPSQAGSTAGNPDGRGSFCYLGRGARFVPGSFPSNADGRLFKQGQCR